VRRRRRRVQQLRRAGHTNGEIARRLRTTRDAVARDVRRMRTLGWEVDARAGVSAEEIQRRDARIAELWATDASGPEIASDLGMKPGTLYSRVRTLRERGVDVAVRRPRAPRGTPRSDRIEELVADGTTYEAVADAVGITAAGVGSAVARLRRAGRDVQYRRGTGTPSRRASIAQLLAEDIPQAEVARRLGISETAVSRHVRALVESSNEDARAA